MTQYSGARFFGKIDTARASGRNPVLCPGLWLLRVERCTMAGTNEDTFVAECTALACRDTKADSMGNQPAKPGQLTSFLVGMTGKWPELALGNIKAFARLLPGGAEVEKKSDANPNAGIFAAYMGRVVGDEQVGTGALLLCQAHEQPQKGDKSKSFTHKNWTAYDDEDPPQWVKDEAKAGRLYTETAAE